MRFNALYNKTDEFKIGLKNNNIKQPSSKTYKYCTQKSSVSY